MTPASGEDTNPSFAEPMVKNRWFWKGYDMDKDKRIKLLKVYYDLLSQASTVERLYGDTVADKIRQCAFQISRDAQFSDKEILTGVVQG
jgi:hypothetical protein